jgi:hypothetical protein
MIESWFQDHVFLAFRIEKALRAHAVQSPFVDYYTTMGRRCGKL